MVWPASKGNMLLAKKKNTGRVGSCPFLSWGDPRAEEAPREAEGRGLGCDVGFPAPNPSSKRSLLFCL